MAYGVKIEGIGASVQINWFSSTVVSSAKIKNKNKWKVLYVDGSGTMHSFYTNPLKGRFLKLFKKNVKTIYLNNFHSE